MKTSDKKENEHSKQVDETLRRMLSTPPQAQKPKKKTQKSDK